MKQKELAALLGISGAAVSKLAKRGMPTDSLERAKRWRKRHLEPGRIKGAKFDPKAPMVSDQAAAVAEVERLALVLLPKLSEACSYLDQEQIVAPLRCELRALPENAQPCLPPQVWFALLEYAVADAVLHAIGRTFTSPLPPCEVLQLQHRQASEGRMLPWTEEVPLAIAADLHGHAAMPPADEDDILPVD